MAAAILRHRLYGVDVYVNRALALSGVTVVLGGLYVGAVLLAGRLLGQHVHLEVALPATALVAVAFHPLRDRLRRSVDRLLHGERRALCGHFAAGPPAWGHPGSDARPAGDGRDDRRCPPPPLRGRGAPQCLAVARRRAREPERRCRVAPTAHPCRRARRHPRHRRARPRRGTGRCISPGPTFQSARMRCCSSASPFAWRLVAHRGFPRLPSPVGPRQPRKACPVPRSLALAQGDAARP